MYTFIKTGTLLYACYNKGRNMTSLLKEAGVPFELQFPNPVLIPHPQHVFTWYAHPGCNPNRANQKVKADPQWSYQTSYLYTS